MGKSRSLRTRSNIFIGVLFGLQQADIKGVMALSTYLGNCRININKGRWN